MAAIAARIADVILCTNFALQRASFTVPNLAVMPNRPAGQRNSSHSPRLFSAFRHACLQRWLPQPALSLFSPTLRNLHAPTPLYTLRRCNFSNFRATFCISTLSPFPLFKNLPSTTPLPDQSNSIYPHTSIESCRKMSTNLPRFPRIKIPPSHHNVMITCPISLSVAPANHNFPKVTVLYTLLHFY